MEFLKAIFLGIIEGLTEFLPVSSTAHLLLSSYLIDFNSVKNNLFEIVIQLGAIFAILFIYREKIFKIIFEIKSKKQQKLILNIALAFLPAALIGGLFHNYIKTHFFSNLTIALALIIGGILMIIIDHKKTPPSTKALEIENIPALTAFLIGLFQVIAMIPGVSRAGSTIIGGLLLGLNRKTATEFSFFLAIPTIAAASLFDLYKNSAELTFSNIEIIFVGLISAFLSAILVIKWFVAFISKHNFVSFGIYRIVLGLLVLFFIV